MSKRGGPRKAKRRANAPHGAIVLGALLTKADLIEIAWNLASIANDAGSCDDDVSTFDRLLDEVETICAQRGTNIIPRTKRIELRATFGAGIAADAETSDE